MPSRAALLLASLVAGCADPVQLTIVAEVVTVRADPDVRGEKLGTKRAGETFEGRTPRFWEPEGWWRVRVGDDTGWLAAADVRRLPLATHAAFASELRVPVLAAPREDAAVLREVGIGTPVVVLNEQLGAYAAIAEGGLVRGYVAGARLRAAPPTDEEYLGLVIDRLVRADLPAAQALSRAGANGTQDVRLASLAAVLEAPTDSPLRAVELSHVTPPPGPAVQGPGHAWIAGPAPELVLRIGTRVEVLEVANGRARVALPEAPTIVDVKPVVVKDGSQPEAAPEPAPPAPEPILAQEWIPLEVLRAEPPSMAEALAMARDASKERRSTAGALTWALAAGLPRGAVREEAVGWAVRAGDAALAVYLATLGQERPATSAIVGASGTPALQLEDASLVYACRGPKHEGTGVAAVKASEVRLAGPGTCVMLVDDAPPCPACEGEADIVAASFARAKIDRAALLADIDRRLEGGPWLMLRLRNPGRASGRPVLQPFIASVDAPDQIWTAQLDGVGPGERLELWLQDLPARGHVYAITLARNAAEARRILAPSMTLPERFVRLHATPDAGVIVVGEVVPKCAPCGG